MYTYEQRMRAVSMYLSGRYSCNAIIKELGYPSCRQSILKQLAAIRGRNLELFALGVDDILPVDINSSCRRVVFSPFAEKDTCAKRDVLRGTVGYLKALSPKALKLSDLFIVMSIIGTAHQINPDFLQLLRPSITRPVESNNDVFGLFGWTYLHAGKGNLVNRRLSLWPAHLITQNLFRAWLQGAGKQGRDMVFMLYTT